MCQNLIINRKRIEMLKKELILFLSKVEGLTESEIREMAEMMTVEEVKKDTILVKEGQLCNSCFFVLKGCLRQFIPDDGLEKTIALYTEEQAVNYYSNQGEGQKSNSYLTAVEDTVVLIGNPAKDQTIYARFPVLENITHRMMESDFGKMQNSFAKFMTSSPQERYLNLLEERPELLQRVPQTIIASYLGITPESLSRIRRRIRAK